MAKQLTRLDPWQKIVNVEWGNQLVLALNLVGNAVGDDVAATGSISLLVVGSANPVAFSEVVGTGVTAGGADTFASTTNSDPAGFPNAPGPPSTIDGPTEEFFLEHILDRDNQRRQKYMVAWQDIRATQSGVGPPAATAFTQAGVYINCSQVPNDEYIDFTFSVPLGSGSPNGGASVGWSAALFNFKSRADGGFDHEELANLSVSGSSISQNVTLRVIDRDLVQIA